MTIQIGDVVGDYKVIDVAGSGGMGAVYKIEHVLTKRIEAMKLLPSGLSCDPEQVLRFEREIQVQARLHHPNITALYNAMRDTRSIALVMEFVEGESLQRILEAGPLPVKTAADYTGQVLSALAYAHEAGVIHRDVSPGNIIITPERIAKLTDFGLARAVTDPQLTTSGVPVGSPWYMSPEQVRNLGDMDARTDIYAMGAVLYEMLTGVRPFDGVGAFEVMRAHMETVPVPPGSRNPKIPPAIDEIVMKALAKDPAMRFQSADEFRLALENVVTGGRPVMVPSSNPPRPATPPRGRRPRAFHLSRAFHFSRAAVLMALAPVALVACLITIRSFPKTVHVPSQVSQHRDAPPVTPATPSALPTPAETPIVAAVPPDVPVTPEKPRRAAPRERAALPPAPPLRRATSKPERSYAIRVIGGEVEPAPSTAPTKKD